MQGKASYLNDRDQDKTMDIKLDVKIASVTKTLLTDTKIKLTKITILYFCFQCMFHITKSFIMFYDECQDQLQIKSHSIARFDITIK